LRTLPGDRYRWLFLPEKKHLFEKPLSKLNTGAYREICTAIGHSIEVRRRDGGTIGSAISVRESSFKLTDETGSSVSPTFTSTIEALRNRNALLVARIRNLSATVKNRNQLIATLQGQCETLEERVRVLHMQLGCSEGQLQKAENRYMNSESDHMKIQEKVSRCRDAADNLLRELQ